MIEAEKQFLQQFMKQQIEGSSVADFHQNLCELLDQYLYFVPSKGEDKNENGSTAEAATIEQSIVEEKNKNEEEEVEEPSSEQVEATKLAETDLIDEEQKNDSEEEPDWGDAFAESGDEVDEATKDGFDAEKKVPGNDSESGEEEPDWGDAFAESGDEVDEATKEDFDAENK